LGPFPRTDGAPWWPPGRRVRRCLEYGNSPNPPTLHRKESFLLPEHPRHARFAQLSAQEEKHGLLADTASIGTRDGWTARLSAAGFAVRGHRLVRRKDQGSKE